LQLDLLEPCPEASAVAITPHVCSVATEVYHQLLGQDFHLLDDDAFHGAPKQLRVQEVHAQHISITVEAIERVRTVLI
jgi:hypothetical protein